MRKLFLPLLAMALSARLAQAQVVPGAPPTDWDKEHQQYTVDVLRAYTDLMNDWREALQRGDAKSAAALYSDGAFLTNDSSLIQGRGAIEAQLVKLLPRFKHLRVGLSDFVASDRLAYALGPAWYEMQLGGNLEEVTGTLVTIIVRDGKKWKIRSQTLR